MRFTRTSRHPRLSLRVVSGESAAREPRLWLADAEAHGKNREGGKQVFGVVLDPEWKTSQDAADRAAIAAAKHHHAIAREIQARIRDAGLSREEAAQKAGMNVNTLGRILNGTKSPTLYQLHRIAGAVGVPFLGGYPRPGDRTLNDAG